MINFASYKSSVVELKRGINENVSSLELAAGELINCKNYMMAEGGYGGYISVKGYERVDGAVIPSRYVSLLLTLTDSSLDIPKGTLVTGTTSAATATALAVSVEVTTGVITVELESLSGDFQIGEVLSTPSGDVGTVSSIETITGGTVDYHAGIEYARDLVQPVPGEGPILGLSIFNAKIYAFRKKELVNEIGLYVEDAVTGWAEVDTSSDPLTYTGGHDFKFAKYNFKASTESFSLFWVDGINQCRMYDGVTVTTIDNSGMSAAGLDAPINIAAHNFHLFLVYRGGSLQHSALGEPTIWDAVVGASEIGLGAEVTNIVAGVASSLIIYLNDGIRILQGNFVDDWVLSVFSDTSGAYENTARRLLGTVFSVGDRGVNTLDAVQEYGDYAANSISQRFKTTLFQRKNSITTCLVSRDLNQYRIFFEDKTGIYISFEGKEQQGATFTEFPHTVSISASGDDADEFDLIVFASNTDEGFVYKMDSGTSFDGTPITCRLSTAFYHYGTPRQYKAFKRATFEINCESGQTFDIKVDFDYNEIGSPRTIWYNKTIYNVEGNAIYGEGKWGSMVYGVSGAVTNRVPVYLQGVGTNMGYKFISNETYRSQHTVQNIITDYTVIGRRV